MDLYIMRHGIAEDSAATDQARNLTDEGVEETILTAKALKKLRINFSTVYSSPYNRTIQTAHTLMSTLQPDLKVFPCPALASGNDSQGLFEILEKAPLISKILLVGHEPDQSRLISRLISGDLGTSIQMKRGSIAKVSFHARATPGDGILDWLLTPKICKMVAGG